MSDEAPIIELEVPAPKTRKPPKRDILRFSGPIVKSIDLGKCLAIDLEAEKRSVVFHFGDDHPASIQFDTEDAAKSVYEYILNMWSGDVVE